MMNSSIIQLEVVRLLRKWPWILALILFSMGLAQAMIIEPQTTNMQNYLGRVLVEGCYVNVMAFGIVLAVISGASLASERNTGTIAFLNRLPVSRSRIYWSKAIFLFLVGGTTLIVLRMVIGLNYFWSDAAYLTNNLARLPSFLWFVPSYLLISAVGICGSAMISNPASSAFLGLLSPIALATVLAYIKSESSWLSEVSLLPIFAAAATVLAVAFLALGGFRFCHSED